MTAESSRHSSAAMLRMPCHIRAMLTYSARQYSVRIREIGQTMLVLDLPAPLSLPNDAEIYLQCAEFGRLDIRLSSVVDRTMTVNMLAPNAAIAQLLSGTGLPPL
ncbi:hypothetical protein ACSV9I_04660 [Rhizobium sp. G187]|uniref:hypothetical protein n=1 Tax=Rhizobium sp. G187 TaxID=3451352 RepID=UPI003EE4E62C